MSQLDPVTIREIPVVRKIIQDETWFEGERRGCHVTSDDPVVREKVCEVVLRIGRELRETLLAQIAADAGSARVAVGPDDHHHERAA